MLGFNKKITMTTAGLITLGTLIFVAATASTAAETVQEKVATLRKAAFIPSGTGSSRPSLEGVARGVPAGSENMLVFSAPPRESAQDGARIYQPIAEYLSRILGKTIVYKYPGDWLTYQTEMQRGSYDLVFDDPHFNSWRISNLRHSTLVKIVDENTFAVVVRKDDTRITDIKQLAGQRICSMDPPNLGTLAVLHQFDNPSRQPLIINGLGWTKAYEGVAFEKKCVAAIVPVANLKKFINNENFVRVVYKTNPLPNQALSAGPRLSVQDQARIAAALMSQDGAAVAARLLAAAGSTMGLTYASQEEYAGFDAYLKDTWGYTR